VSGQLGFQHPLNQAFGQLLKQPMLSKDVLGVRIVDFIGNRLYSAHADL